MASMGNMGAGIGMLVVETIAKIRRAYFVQQNSIKAICRDLAVHLQLTGCSAPEHNANG
jgi:hypothetical protein